MPAATQTRVIRIKVDADGVKQALDGISKSMGAINKNTKELSKGMGFLTNATTTFLGGLSIKTLAGFSDEILSINNRLKAFTGSQEEATSTFNNIVKVSRETNQSIAAVSESYLRMSLALKDANVSQETMIDLTKTIANTFRLSGSTTEEAANATIQLGQAFSLGTLRGQDLRSVMSQNLVLTRLLRQEFGNNLLKAAEKGLITVPKIMEILHKNMQQVNDDAKLMGATFGQTTVKAIDAFKISINRVSEAIAANSLFQKGVDILIKNMDSIVAVMIVLSVSVIPKLIASVVSLTLSLGPLGIAVGVFAALTAGAIAMAPAITKNLNPVDQLARAVLSLNVQMFKFIGLLSAFKNVPGFGKAIGLIGVAAEGVAAKFQSGINQIDAGAYRDRLAEIQRLDREISETGGKFDKDLGKVKKAFETELDPKQQLAALNKQFRDGAINVGEYNKKILSFDLAKANYQFKEGAIDLEKLENVRKKVKLLELNQQLNSGAISMREFSAAIEEVKLKDLNSDFAAGTIDIIKYNEELTKLNDKFRPDSAIITGTNSYIQSIGTVTSNVADAIKNTFSNLENSLVEFVKTGKFNFADFTNAVLEDLTRIILRATIIAPLAQGLLNYSIGPGAGASTGSGGSVPALPGPNAKGNVYDMGLRKFASGGVVDSPTIFGYGKGGVGMMGEAGPEAILPLSRGSGGKLGVQATVTPVTVNVINQTGNEVQQKETTGQNGEKSIDIIITNKVKEGISSGKYDRAFQASYGLNRKGS